MLLLCSYVCTYVATCSVHSNVIKATKTLHIHRISLIIANKLKFASLMVLVCVCKICIYTRTYSFPTVSYVFVFKTIVLDVQVISVLGDHACSHK